MIIHTTSQPWQTPNFVVAKDPEVSWPLAKVDAETLSRMCDEFRDEIFRKAGKPDPRKRTRKPKKK